MFSSLPGVLADRFGGSYVPAYAFFCACAVFVLAAAQIMYGKQRRGRAERLAPAPGCVSR